MRPVSRIQGVRVRWPASAAFIAGLVPAVALASCSSGDEGSRNAVFENGSAGISITLPDGWHAGTGPVTGLLDPRERMVLTSFPIEGNVLSRGCSPNGLLRQLPRSGVAALLLEYMHTGARRNLQRRPDRFRLGPQRAGPFDCFTPQPTANARLFVFSEAGRAFQLLVAVGRTATRETRRTAARTLDSIRIEPCDSPLPTEAHPLCRRPLPH